MRLILFRSRDICRARAKGSVWKSALGGGTNLLELRTSGEKERKGRGGGDYVARDDDDYGFMT